MSDSVTWIVDLDASLDEAKELAERVKAWLIAQGIVSPIPSQAVGRSHLLSRGKSAAMWDAFPHASQVLMCGLEVATERRVFHIPATTALMASDAPPAASSITPTSCPGAMR